MSDDDLTREIKEQLDTAVSLTSGIDEKFQSEAFRFVLERLSRSENKSKNDIIEHSKEDKPVEFYDRLSRKSKLSRDTLKLLIEYESQDNKISLRFTPEGKSLKQQYTDATLIYMACKNEGLSINSVDSKELSKEMKYLGIWDTDNYARNIKAKKSYFVVSGKGVKKYSITQQGIDRGLELLRERARAVGQQ